MNCKRRMDYALSIIGTLCVVLLLTGCGSLADSQGPDPSKYNPITEYPAIGAPSLGH
jgi:hypothetical protein